MKTFHGSWLFEGVNEPHESIQHDTLIYLYDAYCLDIVGKLCIHSPLHDANRDTKTDLQRANHMKELCYRFV